LIVWSSNNELSEARSSQRQANYNSNFMTTVEIRPRFQRQHPATAEQVIHRLSEALKNSDGSIKGSVMDHHIVLRMPVEQQHYWSPQLSLTIEDNMEGGALIRGLYGPRPSVWLMFVFLYSSLGAISLFIGITGFSQLSLGMSAPALWALPVAAGIALILYLFAKAGERLGKDEMHRLRNFMDAALVETEAKASIREVSDA
jgi:hypothetical protein